MSTSSIPYTETPTPLLLTISSFLLALNIINSLLDRYLYCGLIGQVLVGIIWGSPLAGWLPIDLQGGGISQVGYLGLIMVVYEGGVTTSIRELKKNLGLSLGVAVTGIVGPMGLSFLLGPMLGGTGGSTALKSFAAGAALCSTSLGTTFTVLSTSGLVRTRLGSVLGGAAMMDDVVGLVMVKIVEEFGSSDDGGGGGGVEIGPAVVLRPVLVSLGFAVAVPVVNRWGLRPVMGWWVSEKGKGKGKKSGDDDDGRVVRILSTEQAALLMQTGLLFGLVAGAAYAGASVLLAAYLAGIVVCWWDGASEEMSSSSGDENSSRGVVEGANEDTTSTSLAEDAGRHGGKPRFTGVFIYEKYYTDAVNRILKPFFFASIGFSIPITQMFTGRVVWRGILYTLLMILGKLFCGLWLVRFPSFRPASSKGQALFSKLKSVISMLSPKNCLGMLFGRGQGSNKKNTEASDEKKQQKMKDQKETTDAATAAAPAATGQSEGTAVMTTQQDPSGTSNTNTGSAYSSPSSQPPTKPTSLYPAAILSFAMVARGEIGFLISSVAESKGVFASNGPSSSSSNSDESSELFIIVTWAIVLCTVIGPLTVGVLVKRVKRLEKERLEARGNNSNDNHAGEDDVDGRDHVLGVWGVE